MEDDDIEPVFDEVRERAQAIRNIAADLETAKNKDARRILNACADLVLQHLELKSAPVVELASQNGKLVKGRPL